MPRIIPDDGPRSARIVLIGEMDATHEEAQHRHFAGPSGAKLTGWWRTVGLQRSDFYVTNVVPYRANRQNKIELVPWTELAPNIEALHERLAALTDPWLIVPTGNTAMRALIGKSRISRLRGSIYVYRDRRGRMIKVIPTIHPAALFRTPYWEKRCVLDWQRIVGDAEFRELRLPEREHFIKPTIADCWDYYEDARQRAEMLAFDIETPRKTTLIDQGLTKKGLPKKPKKILGEARITCIGYSFESHFSFTIPTTMEYWRDELLLSEAWDIIRLLLQLPCAKGGQNAYAFDIPWLLEPQYHAPVRNFLWDSLCMNHVRDGRDDHAMHYQQSIYTREPYHKDEAKDPDEINKWTADIEQFWRYNGKDNCVTVDLIDEHLRWLDSHNMMQFYLDNYYALFKPMLRAMIHGTRINEPIRARRYNKLRATCITIQDKLSLWAGEALHGPKNLSPKKLGRFLYETLKLPPQYNRERKADGTRSLTTNEVTVRRLMFRFPKKLGSFETNKEGDFVRPDMPGPLILAHRRSDTLSKFYADARYDADGRIRCTYKFGPPTLRLASSKNWRRTGSNMQNPDREMRDAFIPDDGCIILEADLSQAEDRVVKAYSAAVTRDPTRRENLLARARANPWENDEHTRRASLIYYNNPRAITDLLFATDARVTKPQRYLAKRAGHAGNYDMHGNRLSEEILKEGIVISPEEGDQMIGTILDRDVPEVRLWQASIRQEILRNRCLANSWGLVVDYAYDRLSDELYREGYAFKPQSDVGMLLNRWGFVPCDRFLITLSKQNPSLPPARINLQMHDALVISTPPELAWPIYSFLRQSLERPRYYGPNKVIIPLEAKLGANWKTDVEYKRPPSEREFTDTASAIFEGMTK